MTVTAFNDDSISVIFTSRNVKQVNQLVQRIKAEDQDPELSKKLGKAYSSALAFSILLQKTNNQLLKAEQRKEDKVKRE